MLTSRRSQFDLPLGGILREKIADDTDALLGPDDLHFATNLGLSAGARSPQRGLLLGAGPRGGADAPEMFVRSDEKVAVGWRQRGDGGFAQ